MVPDPAQAEEEEDKGKKKTRKGESKAMISKNDLMKKFNESLIFSYKVTYPDGTSDPTK